MYKDEILNSVKQLQPAYLPEWDTSPTDSGWAVAKIFANTLSGLKEQKEQLPNKLFIAYLDKLGFKQNPPLSATVPVSFTLTRNYKGGVTIPKGTTIATKSKLNFETTEAMMVTSSSLVALIDYDFNKGNLYTKDHSSSLVSKKPIELFSKELDEHYIYFGDDNLFNIHKRKDTPVGLEITVPPILNGEWQYFGKAEKNVEPDWYNFVNDGNILKKFNYYGTVKTEINGIESYWFRVKVHSIPSSLLMNFQSYSNVDALFHNDKPLYLKKIFFPFGKTPQINDIFYIASREAFSKKGFMIEVELQNKTIGLLSDELLSWEYWNGASWKALEGHRFRCPMDIATTKVNGEKNHWIRVRLLDNSSYVQYHCSGTDLKPTFTPPELKHINIKVEKRGEDIASEHIYEYKEQKYTHLDSSMSSREFEKERSLYFGFDTPFNLGLISIYFQMKELEEENLLTWYYTSTENDWSLLNVKDGTNGFTQSGFCQFIVPSKQKKVEKFGRSLYWVKARFRDENSYKINAIYMNSIEAREGKSLHKVLLGSSDGSGSQIFTLKVTPIFEVKLWVREAVLPEGYDGYKDRFNEGYWVLWTQVGQLETVSSSERVYTLNASLGEIGFGDDRNGKIPVKGKENIVLSYRTGGGITGNVLAEEIESMVDTVAYVDKVSNPIDAVGGANLQSMENLLTMAPKRIKHRYRTTTREDYYSLVKEASSDVAKVSVNAFQGDIELIIVPFGQQEQPLPSKGLLNVVKRYIRKIAPATVTIEVLSPNYVPLSINIEIILQDWQFATEMKSIVNQQLKRFLHPLYGGKDAQGWSFGTLPLLADFYHLLSPIEGIEIIDSLEVTLATGEDYSINDQSMPILLDNALICNGKHTINFKIGGA